MSARVESLYKSRPRSRFIQASAWAFGILTLLTWLSGVIQPASFLTARRLENLERAKADKTPRSKARSSTFEAAEVQVEPVPESPDSWSILRSNNR